MRLEPCGDAAATVSDRMYYVAIGDVRWYDAFRVSKASLVRFITP